MAAVVDIVNTALARLGDVATVSSLDEASAQAQYASTFYPIARDSMLEMHDWRFAIRRVTLAAVTADTFEWSYAYAVPSDMLRAVSVLEATSSATDSTQAFDIMDDGSGNTIILTNLVDATLLYTVRVTDTTKFSPLFVDALAWLLAAQLAGPLLKGDTGMAVTKSCMGMYGAVLARARESDAMQRKIAPTHTPAWMVR